jgi:hypothetical protein
MQTEHIADLAKWAPTAVVAGTSLAGFRWDTVSYVLASIYTMLMIGNFVWTKAIKPRLGNGP